MTTARTRGAGLPRVGESHPLRKAVAGKLPRRRSDDYAMLFEAQKKQDPGGSCRVPAFSA